MRSFPKTTEFRQPIARALGRAFELSTPNPLKLPSLMTLVRAVFLIAACGLLLNSGIRNWLDIPGMATKANGLEQITAISPSFQPIFQWGVLCGCFAWVSVYFFHREKSMVPLLIAITLMLLSLSFPFFILFASPELAGDVTWLHMQHDNLTWLGGDINLDAQNGFAAWKSAVYWVDTPRQVTIAPLPTWSIWDLGLDKIEDILAWLGYSNAFCQFARPGWFYATLGSFFCILLSVISREGIDFRRTKIGITFVVLASMILVGAALSGPFRSKSHLDRSAQHLRQGEWVQSLAQLHRSAELFPALRQDTDFIAQKALLEHKLQKKTPHAELHQAKQLEFLGKYEQAFAHWKRLCDCTDVPIQRESLRAVLRYAIQDYNSNRFALAKSRLEFVLQRQPGNVKVVYYLQHLSIRQKDPETTYRMCEWMYEVTNFLNFQTGKTLRAVSEQNAVLAALLESDIPEVWRRTIRAKQR